MTLEVKALLKVVVVAVPIPAPIELLQNNLHKRVAQTAHNKDLKEALQAINLAQTTINRAREANQAVQICRKILIQASKSQSKSNPKFKLKKEKDRRHPNQNTFLSQLLSKSV